MRPRKRHNYNFRFRWLAFVTLGKKHVINGKL